MTTARKLGKGLGDISHLFLSGAQDDGHPDIAEITAPDQNVAAPKAAAKTICVLGDGSFHDAFLVINLSLALARLGMRIAVVDMDEQLPCVKFFLGENGKKQSDGSEKIAQEGPLGVRLIGLPRSLAVKVAADNEPGRLAYAELEEIERAADLLVLNAAHATLPAFRQELSSTVWEFLVRVAPESAALAQAYRTIKTIFSENPLTKIGVIISDIEHMYEIEPTYAAIAGAVKKYLDKELYKYGFLFRIQPADAAANIASFYDADLSACVSNIAQIILLRLSLHSAESGQEKFFETVYARVRGAR
ncbi:MAG: hypothetical protein NC924_03010 [Candidatus Omnitrophica bacterium]|nr:hypothetical protein [Candidatus Omnitrophota bacterium]